MAAGLHVSISAETIASIGGFHITNSMFTGIIVSGLIGLFALYFSSKKLEHKKIGYLQNIVEAIVEALYNLCKDIAGPKKGRDFFPLIASAFIFIMLNNWFGLLPGVGTIGVWQPVELRSVKQAHAADSDHLDELEVSVAEDDVEVHSEEEETHDFIPIFRAATADLNTTLALALISMFMVQYYGVKYQGGHYFTKFFNFKQGPIFSFVGFLELLSDISKVISFAFRLFGNIFAGEVLLAVIAFLVPVLAPIPFLGLEIFVGFVQALVFAMLSLVFINMATESHDH